MSPTRAIRAIGRNRPARRVSLFAVAGLVWCASLATAWNQLYSHAYRPAKTDRVVDLWPQDTILGASSQRFRIVIFVHPLCPCTQATLEELDESLTRIPADVAVDAVAVTTGLSADEVESSRTVESLQRMPRVTLHLDASGREQRAFGAVVSGETFAFDREGRLAFHGGLTPARGHQGDSAGQKLLEELACGRRHAPCEAPVFGCRLPSAEGTPTPPRSAKGAI
jgi:hypothetical protein